MTGLGWTLVEVDLTAGLLAVPLAGLFLLLGVPDLDVAWEHQPAHFWLVLLSALLSFLLGLLMAEAAGRRGDDPQRRQPDISRARALLGWQPRVGLEEGLRLTIGYFRAELGIPAPTAAAAAG